jgi:hypothetical protein
MLFSIDSPYRVNKVDLTQTYCTHCIVKKHVTLGVDMQVHSFVAYTTFLCASPSIHKVSEGNVVFAGSVAMKQQSVRTGRQLALSDKAQVGRTRSEVSS